jgi:hypothetical protein
MVHPSHLCITFACTRISHTVRRCFRRVIGRVRQTHCMLSSSCDSKLSSTDTSACYHHESHNVIMRLQLRLVSLTVSMTDASSCETAGMHGACHCTPLKLQHGRPKCPHRLVSSTIKFYAPQTKIWEGGTKDEMRISKEALFHGSWPKSSTHALKSASKIWISSFVPPSQIFVCEGKFACYDFCHI